MPETSKAAAAAPAKMRATVARGRTVVADHPTETRTVQGPNGPITVAVAKHYGPGQEVLLPEEEVARLRQLGFLVDPGQGEGIERVQGGQA